MPQNQPSQEGAAAIKNIGSRDIRRFLRVGLRVTFDPDTTNKAAIRYQSTVVGWEDEKYILIKVDDTEGRTKILNPIDAAALRFVEHGEACAISVHAFDATIPRETKIFRVGWPTEVRFRPLRHAGRIDLSISCEVVFDNGMKSPGELRDLSMDGCGLYVPLGISVGAVCKLAFRFPNGAPILNGRCEVRRVTRQDEGFFAGCKWDQLDRRDRDTLEFYLATRASMANPMDADARRVVIFSADEDIRWLADQLRQRALEVLVANNILRLMVALGTRHTSHLLLKCADLDLDAVALVSSIKKTVECSDIVIITFGPIDPAAEKAQLAAGVARHYNTLPDPNTLAKILAQLQEPPAEG